MNSCWLWGGHVDKNGYGHVWRGGRLWLAHRYLYTLMRGPIPEGLECDHLCRTPSCVNPEHIELVTHRENLLRGRTLPAAEVARTHCPAGHAYDEANTYVTKKGIRQCRACDRVRHARAHGPKKYHRAVSEEGMAEARFANR